MIQLIVNYYIDKSVERQKEINYAFEQNLKNSLFDKIIILVETQKEIDTFSERFSNFSKIEFHLLSKRPTYFDYFQIANELTPLDERDSVISVICNSDIVFDETIREVVQIRDDECFALTRNDEMNWWTQDAWIFRGRILTSDKMKFCLGTRGCDGSIAQILSELNYKISNPARTIHAIHIHKSQIRTWKNNPNHAPFPWLHSKPVFIHERGLDAHNKIVNTMKEHTSFAKLNYVDLKYEPRIIHSREIPQLSLAPPVTPAAVPSLSRGSRTLEHLKRKR